MSTLSVTDIPDVGHGKRNYSFAYISVYSGHMSQLRWSRSRNKVTNHLVAFNITRFICPLTDESKVFDGASELQLDCIVEESSGSTTVKHGGLLSLADLSQPDDFPVPPHNGPSLTEMSNPLPVEPNDIKPDPATGDSSASIGEEKVHILNSCIILCLKRYTWEKNLKPVCSICVNVAALVNIFSRHREKTELHRLTHDCKSKTVAVLYSSEQKKAVLITGWISPFENNCLRDLHFTWIDCENMLYVCSDSHCVSCITNYKLNA